MTDTRNYTSGDEAVIAKWATPENLKRKGAAWVDKKATEELRLQGREGQTVVATKGKRVSMKLHAREVRGTKRRRSQQGKAWSGENDAGVLRLAAKGFSAEQIGKRVGRTAGAVQKRLSNLRQEGSVEVSPSLALQLPFGSAPKRSPYPAAAQPPTPDMTPAVPPREVPITGAVFIRADGTFDAVGGASEALRDLYSLSLKMLTKP